MRLAEGAGDNLTLHLELLRFKRMLGWIFYEVVALLHDGSRPCVEWSSQSELGSTVIEILLFHDNPKARVGPAAVRIFGKSERTPGFGRHPVVTPASHHAVDDEVRVGEEVGIIC